MISFLFETFQDGHQTSTKHYLLKTGPLLFSFAPMVDVGNMSGVRTELLVTCFTDKLLLTISQLNKFSSSLTEQWSDQTDRTRAAWPDTCTRVQCSWARTQRRSSSSAGLWSRNLTLTRQLSSLSLWEWRTSLFPLFWSWPSLWVKICEKIGYF